VRTTAIIVLWRRHSAHHRRAWPGIRDEQENAKRSQFHSYPLIKASLEDAQSRPVIIYQGGEGVMIAMVVRS